MAKRWSKRYPEKRRLQQRRAHRRIRGFERWLRDTTLHLQFTQAQENIVATIKDIEAVRASMKDVPTEELVRQIGEGVRSLEEFWKINACRLAELEGRGVTEEEILNSLREAGFNTIRYKRLFRLFREIADGRLDPDFAGRFASDPGTLAFGRAKGAKEQKKLMNMEEVELNSYLRDLGTGGHSVGNKSESDERKLPDLLRLAGEASPKDVAEMCVDMVRGSKDPKTVAELVSVGLKEFLAPTNGQAFRRKMAAQP